MDRYLRFDSKTSSEFPFSQKKTFIIGWPGMAAGAAPDHSIFLLKYRRGNLEGEKHVPKIHGGKIYFEGEKQQTFGEFFKHKIIINIIEFIRKAGGRLVYTYVTYEHLLVSRNESSIARRKRLRIICKTQGGHKIHVRVDWCFFSSETSLTSKRWIKNVCLEYQNIRFSDGIWQM